MAERIAIIQPHQVGKTELAGLIAARRQHIADLAKCVDCGTDQKTCRTLGEEEEGPGALCCWSGRHVHREDQRAIDALFDEIAAGHVRTVAEVDPPPVLGPRPVSMAWLLAQDVWWYPHRAPATRIEGMAKTRLLNTLHFLERRAPVLANREYWAMSGWLSHPLGPSGDMARDAFEREMNSLHADPLGWLRERPLLKAMYRQLPKRDSKKWHALAARAKHWNTCPMRKARPGPAETCVCVQRDGRTVGATNDPSSAMAT